jgi:hypothetical protein
VPIVVLILLIIVALTIADVRARRRRGRVASLSASGTHAIARAAAVAGGASGAGAAAVAERREAGVPTFKVVALGTRGSGKTMLLSSMYNQLQSPGNRNYFLTAPFDQVVLLSSWFTEAADTDQDWPTGTAVADKRAFTFSMRTRVPSGEAATVLGLDYLDYAGGLLTDVQDAGSTARDDLLADVESADALIGIIDGFWLRRWLIDGDLNGKRRLQQSLTAMVHLMLLATCPVSFVITKWDLLEELDVDDESRLMQVRKRLMSNPGFHDLVVAHGSQRVLRLIPVSAVGLDFAEVDPAGAVTKRSDGRLEPIGVDLPLCAVVPDLFEQIQHELERQHLHDAVNEMVRATRGGPIDSALELGAYIARNTSRMLPLPFVGDAAMAFIDRGAADAGAPSDRRQNALRIADEVESFRSARRTVLRSLQSRIDMFEGRLPSSRLVPGE